MFEKIVNLKHLPTKDSFVYVSNSLRFLISGTCLRLTYHKNKIAYFSIAGSSANLNENAIGLSSLYAKALKIEDDETVIVAEIAQLPTINKILISPVNKDDYDVLESLAQQVQSTLLNQLKVVYEGQIFVIWIGHNLNVTVIVDDVQPISPGILGFLTEVHIKEKSEKQNATDPEQTQNFEFRIDKLKAFARLFNEPDNFKNSNKNFYQDLVYRIIPINNLPFADNLGSYRQFFNIFVSRKYFPDSFQQNSLTTPIIFSMTLLTDDVISNKKIYVRMLIFEDILGNDDYFESIFVDNLIFDIFDCVLGARVLLKHVEKLPFVNKLEIYTKKKFLINVEECFKKYLADNSDNMIVLNRNIPIDIGKIICNVKLFPEESEFVLVDDNFVRNYKCTFHDEHITPLVDKSKKVESDSVFLTKVSNYSSLIEEVVDNFKEDEFFENILVIGKPGTGKSSLLKELSKRLQLFPHFLYTHSINCKSIKGKTTDSLFKVFSSAFLQLVVHQPSVLLLDDLHILCENIKGDDVAPNAIYYNRVSELLHNFFKLLSKTNKIGVCATAESIEKINRNMYTSRGSHLYKNIYTINEFSKADRMELMKFLLNGSDTEEMDFEELSVKTEGFVVQDIVDFCNKIIYEAFKEDSNQEEKKIKLSNKLCDKALQNTCVLSVQNVNLHSPGNKDFSDIGGLNDVKKILIESLLWPAKYPNLFGNAPLRLQSGLLLYGPPGTGKTLLAAAAAKQCGLRLISVKGPELLSKYIGASEQAVRDVFQKAQGVRPCILFFDEFDSLAPRRGHDNTGVTDRVVNQFLTQLDGIESLIGVCILAATSRPDLLDPALLRPGRLDKQLLCPLPDKDGRLDVLKALSKNLDMDRGVDLKKIAELTEWYSGADLQSLLYTAQVSTIEGLLDNDENTEIKSIVTQDHLERALAKTKPSLTRQERIKYDRIYARFQSGNSTEDFKAGSKATLA